MKARIKSLCPLWISVAVILILYYGFVFIVHDGVLVFWGDQTEALIPYMVDLYTQLKEGEFVLWNHSIGFGASNLVYYYTILGSPSFYLNLLLPSAQWIPYFIPVIDVLRFFLIATSAWAWLGKLGVSNRARWIGSLVYTFSGWAMYWLHFSYFLDAYLYLALLLFFAEEMLEGRKKLGFSIIVALSAILSPYILYMFSWLLLIYMSCRLLMKTEHCTLRFFMTTFFRALGYYALGVGMAMFALLPAGLMLLSTNRIGSQTGSLLTPLWGQDLIRVLTSLLSPVINDFDYNIYSSPFLKLDNRVYAVYNYSFILFVLLLPQWLKIRFHKKRVLSVTGIFLYAMLLFPLFYFLFNGNTSIRWSFYTVVWNVMVLTLILHERQQLDRRLLVISGIGLILILAGVSWLSLKGNWTTQTNQQVIRIALAALVFLVAADTMALLLPWRRGSTVALAGAVCLEAVFCLTLRTFNGSHSLIAGAEEWETYRQRLFDSTVSDWIEQQDPGFYRIDVADDKSYAYNVPIAQHFYSFTSYFNVYNHQTRSILDNRFTDSWFLGYSPSKFLIKSLNGMKYYVDFTEDQSGMLPLNFTPVAEVNGRTIYRNSLDQSLGYATSRLISDRELEGQGKVMEELIMLNGIVVPQGQTTVSSDWLRQMPKLADNLINDGFALNQEGQGYLFVDYSQTNPYGIVAYEFYRDGQPVAYHEAYEYGYTAIKVDMPVDEVYIYCRNMNFEAEYIPVDVYWLPEKTLEELFDQLQRQPHFEEVQIQGETITARITVEEECWAATTIPYNPGWEVFCDGEAMAVQEVNEAFIGFSLTPGSHQIMMKFTPVGLSAGTGVSVISVIGAAVLWITGIRNQRRTSGQGEKQHEKDQYRRTDV